MPNKIKFGLKNVHIFPITAQTPDSLTYGEKFRLAGAVELSLKAQGESDNVHADDYVYYSSFANEGYEGELEIVLLSDEFREKILGEIKDNDVLVENQDVVSKPFALGFEVKGDQEKNRFLYYNCTVSRPSVDHKTKEKKISPQTDKLQIKISAHPKNGDVRAKIPESAAGYNTFFDTVYVRS